MTSAEIVAYLERRGVRIKLADSELELDAPENALTPDLVERIRAHKAELLAFLKSATERYDWRANCAELFARARAKVERNLDTGVCPDCGGKLIENKLGDEAAQCCVGCDFTWRVKDLAEIRAMLARRRPQRRAA